MENTLRHPLESEPSQAGPTSRPPGRAIAPVSPSVDIATLELLSDWQQEDATTDLPQLEAAEAEIAVFMKAVNEARTASGEPLIYP